MMGRSQEGLRPQNERPQNRTGQDVALLRPFLATLVMGLYCRVGLRFYDSFNPPAVPGWEGRVPYFSRWEVYLPWLCLTAALAAYLAGALAVRLSGKAVVGTSVVAVAALVASLLLPQAIRARDRDYAENYNTCRQIDENTHGCGGGTRIGVSGELSEAELQAQLRTGPPPYPYDYGFFAAVALGLAVFSAAPRLARRKLGQRMKTLARRVRQFS